MVDKKNVMINGSYREGQSYVRCRGVDKGHIVAAITHRHIPAVTQHSRVCVAGECTSKR